MKIWEKTAATHTQTKSFCTSHSIDSQNGKKLRRVVGRQEQKMPRCYTLIHGKDPLPVMEITH